MIAWFRLHEKIEETGRVDMRVKVEDYSVEVLQKILVGPKFYRDFWRIRHCMGKISTNLWSTLAPLKGIEPIERDHGVRRVFPRRIAWSDLKDIPERKGAMEMARRYGYVD